MPGLSVDLPFTDEDLAAFLLSLRQADFVIGPDQITATLLLLRRLAAAGAMPESALDLSRFIGPVVCRSRRQQDEFARRFESWIAALLRQQQPLPPPPPPVDDRRSVQSLDEELAALRRTVRLRRVLLLLVLLAGLLVLGISISLQRPVSLPTPSSSAPPSAQNPPPKSRVNRTVNALAHDRADQAALALLLGLAAYIAFRLTRRQFLARRYRQAPPNLDTFTVGPTLEQSCFPAVPRDVPVRMRRREQYETQDLDVAATVEACAANAGLFTPVYRTATRIPDYLVLIDRQHADDLQSIRTLGIVSQLTGRGVFVDVFFFDSDPRALTSHRDPSDRESLDGLYARYPTHRLIICADAKIFFSPLTGLPQPFLSTIERWDARSLLTLSPTIDWAAPERKLAAAGFKVLPASPDGFAAATDARLARRLLDDAAAFLPPRYPYQFEDDEQSWLDVNEPAESATRQALDDVRGYLGHTGFAWLASCAVYPEIKAPLTLYLGNQVAHPFQAPILERLARLPWMRRAYMPDWLRRALLRDMARPQEQTIRTSLRALLLTPESNRNGIGLSIAQSSARNLAELWQRHFAGWRDSLKPADPASDRVFLTWINNRLAFRIPREFARLIHHLRSKPQPITSATLSPDTAHYFKPSQGLSWQTFAFGPLCVAFVATAGLLYAFLMHFLFESGGLKMTLPIRYGLAAGLFVVAFVANAGAAGGGIKGLRIRGTWFGIAWGACLTFAFFYGEYKYAGTDAVLGPPFHPVSVFRQVVARLHPGFWSYFLWFVEAGLLLLTTLIVCVDLATQPYCPVCKTWTKPRKRSYGPLPDPERTTREILAGRYTAFFALSRTAGDPTRATAATLEDCPCSATTLITLESRVATRTAAGELVASQLTPLFKRLYVPEPLNHRVHDWIHSTSSIRPNLVPVSEKRLRAVVDALLLATRDHEDSIAVFGELAIDKIGGIREMAALPFAAIAGITGQHGFAENSGAGFVAFIESGIQVKPPDDYPRFIAYDDIPVSTLSSDIEAKDWLKENKIDVNPEIVRKALLEIKSTLANLT